MPKVRCPRALSEICMFTIIDNFDAIYDIFRNAACPSDILEEVINGLVVRGKLQWRHLLILVRSNLRSLRIGPYKGLIWNDIHALIKEQAQNLEDVLLPHIPGLPTTDDLCKLVLVLPKLKILNLNFTSCNDEVLYEIGKSCPDLAELHISGCNQVTDAGVMAASFKGLKIFSVDGTSVTVTGASFILENCPKLEHFHYPDVQNVIAEIYVKDLMTSGESRREYQLRSLTVNSFTPTSLALLNLQPSPFLEVLRANTPNSELSMYPQLNHLQHLEIENTTRQRWTYVDYVLPMLERFDKRLSVLKLTGISNIDFVSLSRLCTSLQELFLDSNLDDEPVPREEIGACGFPKLSVLNVQYCRLSGSHILLLLGQSHGIYDIMLCMCPAFTDDLLNEILLLNPLKSLKELYLVECNSFTLASIYVLFNMHNDLSKLNFFNCERIKENECEEIKSFVVERKFDVQVCQYDEPDVFMDE